VSTKLDAQQLILPDTPPEWADLPDALKEALRLANGVLFHDAACTAVMDGPFVRRRRCVPHCPVVAMNTVLAGRTFLIRNDSNFGYYPRCGRCNQVHQFLTLACIERPFSALTEIYGMLNEQRMDGPNRLMEGFRFGALVPITPAEAELLKQRIRDRGERI
jgi:hypothetical protein